MPRTCCVPLCKSNTRSRGTPSVTTFAFPKNEERKQLWLKNIPRENFVPGNSSAVCIKHFKEQFIIRQVTATRDDGTILIVHRERPKLSNDAYPSIFEEINKVPNHKRKLSDRYGKQITTRNESNLKEKLEELEPSLTDTEDVKEECPEKCELVFAPEGPKYDSAIVKSFREDSHVTIEPLVALNKDPSDGGSMSCLRCKEIFATQSAMKIHAATCQLSSQENKCSYEVSKMAVQETCEVNSKKLAQVVKMYKTVVHTGQTLYSCEECPALFTSYFHLEQHKVVHPGSQPMFCNTSTESDAKLPGIKFHKNKSKDEKIYKCDTCEETFESFLECRIHKRTHTGSKHHCCDVCGKCFQRASKLKVHKRVHTNERPYTCEICSARFTQLGNLNIHKRIHSGERPFQCDICKAAFMQPTHLKVHKRSHTGERPYSCTVCSAAFSQLTSLILHKRSHTGERPFPCDVCDLAFNSRGDLRVHKRRHTGERPYICDICKASFTHLGTLNVHKRRHAGKRPFLCDNCGVAFITHSELKTHKRRHTGEQPYRCDVCGAAFTQVGSLNTHKRRHQDKNS